MIIVLLFILFVVLLYKLDPKIDWIKNGSIILWYTNFKGRRNYLLIR